MNKNEPLGKMESIRPIAGGQEAKGGIGRGDFSWRRDLSENGQKLWYWLVRDMADKDIMPEIAAKEGWDWAAALEELRRHNILDESDAKRVRLIRKR